MMDSYCDDFAIYTNFVSCCTPKVNNNGIFQLYLNFKKLKCITKGQYEIRPNRKIRQQHQPSKIILLPHAVNICVGGVL